MFFSFTVPRATKLRTKKNTLLHKCMITFPPISSTSPLCLICDLCLFSLLGLYLSSVYLFLTTLARCYGCVFMVEEPKQAGASQVMKAHTIHTYTHTHNH